jgi:hypothetical protein
MKEGDCNVVGRTSNGKDLKETMPEIVNSSRELSPITIHSGNGLLMLLVVLLYPPLLDVVT